MVFQRYLLAIGSTPDEGSSKNYIFDPPIKANETHSFLLFPPLNLSDGVSTYNFNCMTLRKYSIDSSASYPLKPLR